MSQLSTHKVIETISGWMIKCHVCQWHEFPKKHHSGTWRFNGNLECPTFTPSMNELVHFSEASCPEDRKPDRRCHFVVSDGNISYCPDCTHALAGQSFPLDCWPLSEVHYYQFLLQEHR
jgi:hypothetical protein